MKMFLNMYIVSYYPKWFLRAVRPENVMLDRKGGAKLGGLRRARMLQREEIFGWSSSQFTIHT